MEQIALLYHSNLKTVHLNVEMKWPGVMDEQAIFPVVFEKPTDMFTCLFNLEYTWSRWRGIYIFLKSKLSW
jgi:hypothetical protein